ncbi:MAG: PadR family transcriptional regulator [Oscillospiraceae bacterium]|jgi:DNA-binding PadR family transcriptional regulator|nr:PadR family transcriptional regulator [Oscillospiraceae bacterium]
MKNTKNKNEPMTESYFYILLCLEEGANHGYGIMQRALELSDGSVTIGSGTMYGAISNMLSRGWIEECAEVGVALPRKRQYRLAQEGREALLSEARRLCHLAETAQNIINKEEKAQ